jgi:hypothetical protein
MKQALNIFFKIKTPYGSVYISINQSDKQFINSLIKSDLSKIVKDKLNDDEYYYEMGDNLGLCFWGSHDIIRIRDYTKDLEFHKTLIHEINHCVYYHLHFKNINQNQDNTEAFSYLFEFLYGEVIEEINRTLKKIKAKVKKKPILSKNHLVVSPQ